MYILVYNSCLPLYASLFSGNSRIALITQYFYSVTLWGKNESSLRADQVIEVGDNMFMIESETNSDDYYSVDMR